MFSCEHRQAGLHLNFENQQTVSVAGRLSLGEGGIVSGPDIFISYSREDSAMARTYRDAFESEGFEVWWDQALRSGETYDEVTETALRSAKAVVVLWSPRSVASRWVRAEATIADRNKTFVPVMIEPCDRPVMFELTQTADLSHWTGDQMDMGWKAIVDGLRHKLGRDKPPPANARIPTQAEQSIGFDKSGMALVGMLPISHRGNDEDLGFLAEDLTEEITRELSQNGWFKMIAARKMSVYQDKSVDYVELGRELGAAYLIDGKLQRSGENVRLTLQIVDTATGSVLHSARSSRNLEEASRSPEEFAIPRGTELADQVVQIETSRALNKTASLTGWEHLLRAKSYEGMASSEGMRRILEACRAAVELLPDHGQAHAHLAAALTYQMAAQGQAGSDNIRQEIRSHATIALELDRNNPIVLGFLIVVYAVINEGETGLQLARRLVELRPNTPTSHYRLFNTLVALGRTAEAIPAFEKYAKLAPHDPHRAIALVYVGMCQFLEGQMSEAQTSLDAAQAIQPGYYLVTKWKAIIEAANGNEQGAIALVRQLRELETDMPLETHVQQMRQTRSLAERSAEAVEILRRLWAATEQAA